MAEQPFHRTALTGLSYTTITFFAFFQASIGPIVPFLEKSLELSHSLAGSHMTLFAAGMILGGQLTPHLSRRLSRPRVFPAGLAVLSAGTLLLTAAIHPAMTLSAAFLMGLGGVIAFSLAQAFLSQQHGTLQGTAITEANIFASLGTTSLPLLIGLSLKLGLTWRGAFWFSLLFFLTLILLFRRKTPLPQPEAAPGGNRNTKKAPSSVLPPRFWLILTILFLGVAVEWGTVFWGASYMEQGLRFSESSASTLMSVLFFGMVLARFTASRLAKRIAPGPLLAGAVLTTLAGLPLFLMAPAAPLNIAGLLLSGFGIANFYPLTAVLGFTAVPGQSDRISGYLAAAAGLSILTAPFLLGILADGSTLRTAYGSLFVLLLIILALLAEVARRNRRKNGGGRG